MARPSFFAALFIGLAWSAQAADFKPIVLDPRYNHDQYVTTPTDIVRNFRAYMTSFDSGGGDGEQDPSGIPHFVAYEIKKHEGELAKGPKRPSTWITDKELAERGIAPKDATYRYSKAFRDAHPNWYDRGHLCMKQIAWRMGANADWNTHTVLNAVPQRHDFNAGIWKDLEEQTAEWADSFGSVWVLTGPIIYESQPRTWLGEASKSEMLIAIPHALFKIVIKDSGDPDRPDVLAFIYPQEGDGYKRGPFDHVPYLASVDEIEELTGLDFLTAVPNEHEEAIESVVATELWEASGSE
jgi:DNA/RNA endonuclease G (NUC1)